MKYFLFFILSVDTTAAVAQVDFPDSAGVVSVQKDSRIDVLGQKMYEYNKALSLKPRSTKGYRLMLLNTSDREMAMQVRSKLLQQFPSQSVYMSFQSPYIKLKFGNFEDRNEAERFRKNIMAQKIVAGNVYVVAETIEIKPKKEDEEED